MRRHGYKGLEDLFMLILSLVCLLIYFIYRIYKKYKRKQWELILINWLEETEPKNRNFEGYPPDWGFRKYVIRNRFNNKCSDCQVYMRKGFHIHHKIPVSKGGDHSLDNLELLCESCHIKKHPGLGFFAKKRSKD